MLALHTTLSYPTCPSHTPDPLLRIRYDNVHHSPNRRMSFDEKGLLRSDPACENLLKKYDVENKGGLSFQDLLRFLAAQRHVTSAAKWLLVVFECKAPFPPLLPYFLISPPPTLQDQLTKTPTHTKTGTALYTILAPYSTVLHNADIRAAYDGSILSQLASEQLRQHPLHPSPNPAQPQDQTKAQSLNHTHIINNAQDYIAGTTRISHRNRTEIHVCRNQHRSWRSTIESALSHLSSSSSYSPAALLLATLAALAVLAWMLRYFGAGANHDSNTSSSSGSNFDLLRFWNWGTNPHAHTNAHTTTPWTSLRQLLSSKPESTTHPNGTTTTNLASSWLSRHFWSNNHNNNNKNSNMREGASWTNEALYEGWEENMACGRGTNCL